jgi:hypothetical protein
VGFIEIEDGNQNARQHGIPSKENIEEETKFFSQDIRIFFCLLCFTYVYLEA